MKTRGYTVEMPNTVDDLRSFVLDGNAKKYGQDANVITRGDANEIVEHEPYLREIEEVWGPAPGKHLTDGSGVFILGKEFGNVVIGIQATVG